MQVRNQLFLIHDLYSIHLVSVCRYAVPCVHPERTTVQHVTAYTHISGFNNDLRMHITYFIYSLFNDAVHS